MDKIDFIKEILNKKLTDFDFEKQIIGYEKQLKEILNTPADEYSLSGNLEYGIQNILNSATGVNYPLAYLNAKRDTYKEILNLLNEKNESLEHILNKPKQIESKSNFFDDILKKSKSSEKEKRNHFYDCKLSNDLEWGSEDCICPGAYVYKKYLAIGLNKEEAKLISKYRELGDLLNKEEYTEAKELYDKHKFLKL